jgi:hypothetical protein
MSGFLGGHGIRLAGIFVVLATIWKKPYVLTNRLMLSALARLHRSRMGGATCACPVPSEPGRGRTGAGTTGRCASKPENSKPRC